MKFRTKRDAIKFILTLRWIKYYDVEVKLIQFFEEYTLAELQSIKAYSDIV